MAEVTISSPDGNNQTTVQSDEDGFIQLDLITTAPDFATCISLKYKLGDSEETIEIKPIDGRFEPPSGGWSQDGITITAVFGPGSASKRKHAESDGYDGLDPKQQRKSSQSNNAIGNGESVSPSEKETEYKPDHDLSAPTTTAPAATEPETAVTSAADAAIANAAAAALTAAAYGAYGAVPVDYSAYGAYGAYGGDTGATAAVAAATATAGYGLPDASGSSTEQPGGVRDLVVLGVAPHISENDLSAYFSAFGELAFMQVKRDPQSGIGRGFAFIRFKENGPQERVLAMDEHQIAGKKCIVRVPDPSIKSQGRQQYGSNSGGSSGGGGYSGGYSAGYSGGGGGGGGSHRDDTNFESKVYISNISHEINQQDLRTYFNQYGKVTHVYIPRPEYNPERTRSFAFVTFMEPSIAQSLVGTTHTIKNCTMNVGVARPKSEIDRMKASGGYSSGSSYPRATAVAPYTSAASTVAATAYDPYSAAAAAAYAQNPYAAYAYAPYAAYGAYAASTDPTTAAAYAAYYAAAGYSYPTTTTDTTQQAAQPPAPPPPQ